VGDNPIRYRDPLGLRWWEWPIEFPFCIYYKYQCAKKALECKAKYGTAGMTDDQFIDWLEKNQTNFEGSLYLKECCAKIPECSKWVASCAKVGYGPH
jgi:hypothetical protein